MALKTYTAIGLLLACLHFSAAQPTKEHVGTTQYPHTMLGSYLSKLAHTNADTAKANLLLRIGNIYHSNEAKSSQDSAIRTGRAAASLSKSLNYVGGYNNAIYLVCKAHLAKNDFNAAKQMLKEVNGEMSICLLLTLSEYFVNNKDAKREDLQKAYPFLEEAQKLSLGLHSTRWLNEIYIAKGKYYFRLGNIDRGKSYFHRVIQFHKNTGDKRGEARWWQDLARYQPEVNESTYQTQIYSYGKARALYQQLGDADEVADCLHEEGKAHLYNGRPDLAEDLLLQECKLIQSAGLTRKLSRCYQKMSDLYRSQNNFDRALQYAFLALGSLKSAKDSSQLNLIYWTIGDIYHSLGDHPASIRYYNLVLSSSPLHVVKTYSLLKNLVDAQIKIGHAPEGLRLLKTFLKNNARPETALNRQLIAFMFGNCYAALKDFRTAEKYYLQVIQLNNDVEQSEKFWWRNVNSISGAEAFLTMGRFYTQVGKYDSAGRYLKTALTSRKITPAVERDTRYLLFKVDSAAGNYMVAIRNYQRFKMLGDSIENSTKNKEVSILKANFKAAQKEKDIRILTKEATLNKEKLELAARAEKFLYAGFAVLICLLGLSLNSYRMKQNKNRQLEEQQKTISIKNASLMQLVGEKEWLLREVHHRVKNNLQIVISLLNSQSAYLREEVAVNAIVESRHRIQAMSMLHQRIYQSEDMASIGMSSYIHELISYLDSSFNTGRRVIFDVAVEKIELDLSHAVPLGLILNEAITNSLKYAFPNGREGKVSVSFTVSGEENILLRISDDGIGLPTGLNLDAIETFGLKLIKGLAEDLDGTLTVQSGPGTSLEILFPFRSTKASPTYSYLNVNM